MILAMALLCAINRFAQSIGGAAPSMDLSLAQASVDGAMIDRSRCAFDVYFDGL